MSERVKDLLLYGTCIVNLVILTLAIIMAVKIKKVDAQSEIDFSNIEQILDDWRSPFLSAIEI
jgi:hypothetical protein